MLKFLNFRKTDNNNYYIINFRKADNNYYINYIIKKDQIYPKKSIYGTDKKT